MAQRIRVGLIGSGMIAQVMHLPHLLELPDLFEVVVLCDLSPGTVRAAAERFGIAHATTDYADLFDKYDADAVLVLTRDHARPAIDAARAGKHVFVEKPVCNNLAEADELVDTVRQQKVVGMVGYHKRYDPGYRLGQGMIKKLDSPHLVRLHDVIGPNSAFLAHSKYSVVDDLDAMHKQALQAEHDKSLRVAIGDQPEAVMRAYDLMLGLSTHDVTILHGALGLPERVIATEIWSNGMAYASLFAYPGDLRCVFDTGLITGLRKFDESLTVYSADKVVSIAFPSPFIKNAPTMVETWETEGGAYKESEYLASYQEAFKEELIHFHECITNGLQPETPISEGRDDIALLIDMIKAFRP